MISKRTAAFTLIELMVVMGIAAVLLLLSIVGIRILQQQGRDSNRLNALAEIAEEINAYRITYLRFPANQIIQFLPDGLYISGSLEYELTGYLSPDSFTTNNSTKYYYNNVAGGFILCAEKESKTILSAGTVDCPTTLP